MYKKGCCTCRIVVLFILTYCFFEVVVLKLPPESEVGEGCILLAGYLQHCVTNPLSYIWERCSLVQHNLIYNRYLILNTTTTSKTYRPTATSDEFFQVLRAELLRLDALYFLLKQTNKVTDCFFRKQKKAILTGP